MSNREPVSWIELDMDYCSLTFGSSPCTAALSAGTLHKCWQTFPTCGDTENFTKSTITYKFAQPRSLFPKGATVFPCLVDVTGSSAKANIAGSDPELYALGKRAKITASMYDFPYHDRFQDKYQSERISGAAQFDGVGYDPAVTGTFWQKFRARHPNYAGRPMRRCTGYVDGGVLVTETVSHFIVTDISVTDSNGRVSIEGKDILKLADDDRAVAPLPSKGYLPVDIDSDTLDVFDLLPVGIGDSEYETSGFAAIGSELVSFTRSGDTITLTGRGANGTRAASHSVNDTFQQTFSPRSQRIDSVIYDLLILAGVDPSFIPLSDWQDECDRWATNLLLTADIMKPEGVAKLIGELAILGISIWWDDIDQEIKLLVNHPVDLDNIDDISDTANIIRARQIDRDKDRLTRVIFNTVQNDPSRGVSEDNFARTLERVGIQEDSRSYGDTRIKQIFCRWLNSGDDANVRILSIRLLNRFKDQPVRHEVLVGYDNLTNIGNVVRITSDTIPSVTGKTESQLTQVIMREEVDPGHTVKLLLQKFQFDERYPYFTENSRPVYNSSTQAQKDRGAYWADGANLFDDGTGAYGFA